MKSLYFFVLLSVTVPLGMTRAADSSSPVTRMSAAVVSGVPAQGSPGSVSRTWYRVTHKIRAGETFASILRPLGVSGGESHYWFQAVNKRLPKGRLTSSRTLYLYFEEPPAPNKTQNLTAIQIETKASHVLSWTLAHQRIAFSQLKPLFNEADAAATPPAKKAIQQKARKAPTKTPTKIVAPQPEPVPEDRLASVEHLTHVVRRGETLAKIFNRMSVPTREAHQWFRAVSRKYSVKRMRPGRRLVFYFTTAVAPNTGSQRKQTLRGLQIETGRRKLLTWQKEGRRIAYRGANYDVARAQAAALKSPRLNGVSRGTAQTSKTVNGVKGHSNESPGIVMGRYPGALRKLPLSEYTLARVKQRNGLSAHTAAPITGHRPVASLEALERITTKIKPGETLLGILKPYRLNKEDEREWLSSIQRNYVAQKLQPGSTVQVYFTKQGTTNEENDPPVLGGLKAFEIELPGDEFLTWYRSEHGIVFYKTEPPFDVEIKAVAGEITSSLYTDAARVGLHPAVIAQLVDIFGWDINFETDLRKGDAFHVLYKREFRPGSKQPSKIRVLAAEIVNGGHTHAAIYFENANGTGHYYDLDGRTVSRSLLRYPVEFRRISSTFSQRRYHPILRVRRPHRGVDFAAKRRTPVRTVGSGLVTYAGWKGAYGRFIEIDHRRGLKTRYAHLHRIAPGVRPGAHVYKGQVIGSVGCSGRCTGPHLHFEMWRNDHYVNPLRTDFPPDDKLDPTVYRFFEEAKASFLAKLTAQP